MLILIKRPIHALLLDSSVFHTDFRVSILVKPSSFVAFSVLVVFNNLPRNHARKVSVLALSAFSLVQVSATYRAAYRTKRLTNVFFGVPIHRVFGEIISVFFFLIV